MPAQSSEEYAYAVLLLLSSTPTRADVRRMAARLRALNWHWERAGRPTATRR